MGKLLTEIGPREAKFIESQKVFFVATAPLSEDHHVSVSPKSSGMVVLDRHTVMYGDLTGSGAETAAHVLQNGRMTLLFGNLESGPPKILRLAGKAEVILAENAPAALVEKLPDEVKHSIGFRAIYKLRVTRISTSCGYTIPVMEFKKFRSSLTEFAEMTGKEGLFHYVTKRNSYSIDGLPSLAHLRKNAPEVVMAELDGLNIGKVVSDAKGWKEYLQHRRLLLAHQFSVPSWSTAGVVLVAFVAGAALGQSLPKRWSR